MRNKTKPRVIPVAEENLRVRKRTTQTDRLRLNKAVTERTEIAEAWLRSGEVAVERVAIDRPIEAVPQIREEDGTIVVPVVEEVMVVEKRLVLKEEIRIQIHEKIRHVRRPVRLRSEEVSLERPSVSHATQKEEP